MAASSNERVKKRRDAMRAAGLRPIQIWVPDTRRAGFAEECARQARLMAEADRENKDLQAFMDAAWADFTEDWPE